MHKPFEIFHHRMNISCTDSEGVCNRIFSDLVNPVFNNKGGFYRGKELLA
jgi:hypothetical protein